MLIGDAATRYFQITAAYGLAHGIAWSTRSDLYTERAARCVFAGVLGPWIWPLMAFTDVRVLECRARGMPVRSDLCSPIN
jgi:hypothetical protein